MKRLMIRALLALCTLAPLTAFAGRGPAKIPVHCKIGPSHDVYLSLQDCGDKIDAYGYGWYWCSGNIDETFAAKFTGYQGTGGVEIRITYLPGKFSGVSPIEIEGQEISCELLRSGSR